MAKYPAIIQGNVNSADDHGDGHDGVHASSAGVETIKGGQQDGQAATYDSDAEVLQLQISHGLFVTGEVQNKVYVFSIDTVGSVPEIRTNDGYDAMGCLDAEEAGLSC